MTPSLRMLADRSSRRRRTLRYGVVLIALIAASCAGGDASPSENGSATSVDSNTTDSSSSPESPGEDEIASSGSVACQVVPEGFGSPGDVEIETDVVAAGLETPWAIDWLPDGDMLVTERSGAILRVTEGTVVRPAVAEISVEETSEGGLLGLAVHPDFGVNRWFYIYYGGANDTNQVERWVLAEDKATAAFDQTILADIPAAQFHSGGRLRFGPDGNLYIGTGDAATLAFPQDLDSLSGKILRVTDEGDIPEDNPFPDSPVWAYGARNTQGLTWTEDGIMIATDHGPSGLPHEDGRSGHDELNIVTPGANLGWPDAFACEQGDDVVSPVITWAEALPPGGVAVYTGSEIPEWQGDILIGVLGFGDIGQLHRVSLDSDNTVEVSESYLVGSGFGRIRDVAMGPDGGLYFTTSNCDGRGDCGDGDLIVRVGRGYSGVTHDVGEGTGRQEGEDQESAANAQILAVEPVEVTGPGEQDFVVQGSGWTIEGLVFVLPCYDVNTLADLGQSDTNDVCDFTNLTPIELSDGEFEVTVRFDVPATGMCIAAGDAAQIEATGACVAVTAEDGS